MRSPPPHAVIPCLALLAALTAGCGGDSDDRAPLQPITPAIQQIFDKPAYRNATWGLRVVDRDSGQVVHDLNSERRFLTASVRKLFSVGLALDTLGPGHVMTTVVHRQGTVDSAGALNGDLILVANGDLSMGRRNPDGSFAISNFDHSEANALGNAELTAPDPLAGFDGLALQVAAFGITHVTGEVVIDDRLFEPFDFRGEFDVRPIVVNDNMVDVSMNLQGGQAVVDWRPKSAAFSVQSSLLTGAAGSPLQIDLEPELPGCIGSLPCTGNVAGTLPVDLVPPLTGRLPLIRTFRITEPSNYARTVFIEALARAGVSVAAPVVAPNPVQVLPAGNAYPAGTRVAELLSSPYKDTAKLILKVSYNLGADMSLMLFGLAKGANTLAGALAAEQAALAAQFGIDASQFSFIDGSGGGESMATLTAVTTLLTQMSLRASFPEYLDAQPRLGVDGSLGFVTDFESDPALAGAKGQVHAKTGTFVDGSGVYRAQALAGYIDAKSGRRLAFMLVVNEVGPIAAIDDVLPVFQDQGTIAAILWNAQ